MTEPLPSAQADPETPAPTNASDRAAAAALSSLNSTTTAATSDPNANATSSKAPSKEDQDALNEAMSRLEGKEKSTKETEVKTRVKVGKYAEEEERRKKFAGVKVKMEDVAVLIEELELSKVKATELLKANEADVKKALLSFIRPKTQTA